MRHTSSRGKLARRFRRKRLLSFSHVCRDRTLGRLSTRENCSMHQRVISSLFLGVKL